MRVYEGLEALIGHTPLMKLSRFYGNSETEIYGKMEYLNPAGSSKDRVGLSMILDAEKRGILKAGGTIVEPTSGNTGIGLAAVASARGYKIILTMPETMSEERKKLLNAYGAKLVLTDGEKGMDGAIAKARELAASIPGSFLPGQFDNPANPLAHRQGTGPEIWTDLEGKVDIFVAGVGTGGTLSGVGEYLKSQNPDIVVVAVEPADSPVLSGGSKGAHQLQGIGAGFVPKNLNMQICDRIIAVTTEQAYETGRQTAKTEGILVGISSGAALWAAKQLAEEPKNYGKHIVALLPDGGERYLSVDGYLGQPQ